MSISLAEIRRSRGRFLLLVGSTALLVVLLLFFRTVGGALTGALTGTFDEARAEVWVYADAARGNPFASVLDDDVTAAVGAVDGVEDAAAVTFLVVDVDEEPTALVATTAGSPALPSTTSDGALPARPSEALAGVSSFVEGTDASTVAITPTTAIDVVGRADGAVLNVLPTFYVSRDVGAAVVADRAGEGAPLPTNAVAVTVTDGADPTSVAAAVTDRIDGVEAYDRRAAIAALPGTGEVSRSFTILDVLLAIVVAIVTAVFFQILTVQKRDSLVLLRAVGATPRDLVALVLTQVVVVVGGAIVVGAGLASVLLYAARDVFGSGLSLSSVLSAAIALLVLGLLAGALSLVRVLAADTVDAVRGGGLS